MNMRMKVFLINQIDIYRKITTQIYFFKITKQDLKYIYMRYLSKYSPIYSPLDISIKFIVLHYYIYKHLHWPHPSLKVSSVSTASKEGGNMLERDSMDTSTPPSYSGPCRVIKIIESPRTFFSGWFLSLALAECVKILGAPGPSSLDDPGLGSLGVSCIGSGLGEPGS